MVSWFFTVLWEIVILILRTSKVELAEVVFVARIKLSRNEERAYSAYVCTSVNNAGKSEQGLTQTIEEYCLLVCLVTFLIKIWPI